MTNTLLTQDSPEVILFFQNLKYLEEALEADTEKFRPVLDGERYLTEQELSEHLKITRRTLIDHRTNGRIHYYRFGGRILYKESDIVKILESNRMEAFNPA